jgi:nucleoside-diphosphate-sugar epimerase
MTSVVLIPGAGGVGWYWHLVERDLQSRGYDVIAMDLAARGRTGLPAYADAVVDGRRGPRRRGADRAIDGSLHRTAGVAADTDPPGRVRQRDDPAARRDTGRMVGERGIGAAGQRQP